MSESPQADRPLSVETVPLGPLATNAYIVRNAQGCWVIDPGMQPQALLDRLAALGCTPTHIVLTHGHGDHIAGIGELKARWPDLRVLCPVGDGPMLADPWRNMSLLFGHSIQISPADELVAPGDVLQLGSHAVHVLDTAGHSPGGVSFYCPAAGIVFTGDALFARSIGRTDFPGASSCQLIENIRRHLLTLPEETVIYPGHGPTSTIGEEKQHNSFLRED